MRTLIIISSFIFLMSTSCANELLNNERKVPNFFEHRITIAHELIDVDMRATNSSIPINQETLKLIPHDELPLSLPGDESFEDIEEFSFGSTAF